MAPGRVAEGRLGYVVIRKGGGRGTAGGIKQGGSSIVYKGVREHSTSGQLIHTSHTMHFSSYLALLGACGGVWAAPVEQAPLAGNGAPRVFRAKTPYTRDHRDPYDRKVDSIGDKLNPLPWVSQFPLLVTINCS